MLVIQRLVFRFIFESGKVFVCLSSVKFYQKSDKEDHNLLILQWMVAKAQILKQSRKIKLEERHSLLRKC